MKRKKPSIRELEAQIKATQKDVQGIIKFLKGTLNPEVARLSAAENHLMDVMNSLLIKVDLSVTGKKPS